MQRQLARQRYLRRDWLSRQPILVIAFEVVIVIWSLVDLVMLLLSPDPHPVAIGYQLTIVAIVLASAWWWLRELHRARQD